MQIKIIRHTGGGLSAQSTSITGGSSTHAEVTSTIAEGTTQISIRVEQLDNSWPTDGVVFTDNWCLEEV